jgi:long-chain fatty acid transport protein
MKKNKLFLVAFASIISLSNQSFAAGYSTNLYSTSGLGNAYAGSSAGVHDISDTFQNPAVTAGIKNTQLIASMSYLKLSIDTDSFPNGNDSKKGGTNIFVPAFYLSTPINKETSFNFSITSPFGLANKYDQNWAGKDESVETSITTININPSISHKITDNFSIGGGVMAQYYEATMTKISNVGYDALTKVSGDDWGYGYNLGAKYQVNDKLKFGIGYRSKISYDLTGKVQVNGFGQSDFHAATETPESATFGAAYKLNPQVELAYELNWTRWSRVKRLIITANQNSALSGTTTFNFRDSLQNSVGANFKINDQNLIRTGVAYEKDAVTTGNRTAIIPTGDRIWTTIGLNHKIKNGWSFDGAYCHQFFRVANSSNQSASKGKYKTRVDIISIAVKKDF